MNTHIIESWPRWLRWILVLPVAVASYWIVQLLVSILLYFADFVGESNWPHSMNDLVCQITNSFAGPYAFVFTGTLMAPSRKNHSAITLATLGAVLVVGITLLGIITSTHYSKALLIASAIIGLIGFCTACAQVAKDESVDANDGEIAPMEQEIAYSPEVDLQSMTGAELAEYAFKISKEKPMDLGVQRAAIQAEARRRGNDKRR